LLARPARLGPQVDPRDIGDEAWRASLRSAGFGPRQVEGIAGMSAVTCDDFVPQDKRDIVTTTPTTLAAWAHAHLRPALVSTPPARSKDL
jgi:hypothetical protein